MQWRTAKIQSKKAGSWMKTGTPKRTSYLIAALCVVVAACLIVGGTLAFSTVNSEERLNKFTFEGPEGMDSHLKEPDFDGIADYEYDDAGNMTPIYGYDASDGHKPIYGYIDNDPGRPIKDKNDIPSGATDEELRPVNAVDPTHPLNPVNGEPYGSEVAEELHKGSVVLKNPMIYNSGKSIDEWVAAKITFVYQNGPDAGTQLSAADYALVTRVVDIDWNYGTSALWELIATEDGEGVISDSRNTVNPGDANYPYVMGDPDYGKPYNLQPGDSGYQPQPGSPDYVLQPGEFRADPAAAGGPVFTGGISRTLFYKEILDHVNPGDPPGVYDTTEPMFTRVAVKTGATDADIKRLVQIGGFTIFIEGFAAQSNAAANYNGFRTWGAGDATAMPPVLPGVHFDFTPAAFVPPPSPTTVGSESYTGLPPIVTKEHTVPNAPTTA
jgi:hypothetical protein